MKSPEHNVGGWIARRAVQAGGDLAIVDGDLRLDYAALEDRVARLATWLRAEGVGPGDRVALLLANRSLYLEAVFATARIGALSVPINTRLSPREIGYVVDDCRPRLVLHEPELAETVAKALARAATTPACFPPEACERARDAAAPAADVHPVSPDDPMMLMYTSGTTGQPKGAVLPHRKTLFNSLNAERFFGLTPRDRLLVVAPLFHSLGLAILSLPALYAGAALVLRRHFEPEEVWETVGREGLTFFGGVPTMYQRLYDALAAAPAGRYALGTLRFLFTAGSAIPVELIRAFEGRGLVLKQGYGQTETSILCCLHERDAVRKAGSVGKPVLHAELRIVAPETAAGPVADWRDTAPGETGEIVVRGPITMLGYWEKPDATAETLREDGWLRTGDLASFDAEGFVTLAGRARDMFISGGENVYPAEVESVFEEHPDVLEIAVVGEPDPRWGEVGCAHVVLAPGTRLEPEALSAWARERLAKFKIPARYVETDALPRTATGKVQKHELAARGGR
ncbi:MAG: long-chain fatty acid--CoA ligase [Proteobacteria bacterium]|nr:long-chain fatty acid--CoA ligase [Pseudomonadota bacterium]